MCGGRWWSPMCRVAHVSGYPKPGPHAPFMGVYGAGFRAVPPHSNQIQYQSPNQDSPPRRRVRRGRAGAENRRRARSKEEEHAGGSRCEALRCLVGRVSHPPLPAPLPLLEPHSELCELGASAVSLPSRRPATTLSPGTQDSLFRPRRTTGTLRTTGHAGERPNGGGASRKPPRRVRERGSGARDGASHGVRSRISRRVASSFRRMGPTFGRVGRIFRRVGRALRRRIGVSRRVVRSSRRVGPIFRRVGRAPRPKIAISRRAGPTFSPHDRGLARREPRRYAQGLRERTAEFRPSD